MLLEDIDSAGIQREDMKTRRPKKKTYGRPRYASDGPPEDEDEGVTLSGLLNVLDGVRAAEGRILIMTSNTPDSLDEALIRQGRVDKKTLFGPASKEVAITLFEHIFCKKEEELLDDEKAPDPENIKKLAQTFAASFPERTFTPAEVQGYLLDRRTDAEKAVAEAAAFFEGVLETRAKGKNVAGVSGAGHRVEDVGTRSGSSEDVADGDAKWTPTSSLERGEGGDEEEAKEEVEEEVDEEDEEEVQQERERPHRDSHETGDAPVWY